MTLEPLNMNKTFQGGGVLPLKANFDSIAFDDNSRGPSLFGTTMSLYNQRPRL
jgi:hypothetical protein